MKVSRFLLAWLVLLTVCLLVRLPHLLSTHSYIDEDEAIIGLMARDMLEGRPWSYYFYGQNYGLSIVETLSSSLFIKMLGSTTMALRMGGLLIFSLGLTFLYNSFKRDNLPQLTVILLMLLLASFPTWFMWGAMVRGGYVTSFMFVCIIYSITTNKVNHRFSPFLIGLLVFFTLDGHPLLILAILPFLLNWWIKNEKKWIGAGKVLLSFGIACALIKSLFTNPDYAAGLPVKLSNISWTNFLTQMKSWTNGYSGFFYYFTNLEIPFYWLIGIYLMNIGIFVYIILLCLKNFKSHKIVILSSIISLLLGLVLLTTIENNTPRYFVGLYTIVLFLLVFLVTQRAHKYRNFVLGALTAICLVGITSGSKIRRFWVEDISLAYEMNEVHKFIEKKNVKAIIALDHQFTWNYYYGDKIPASGLCWNNRTSLYSHKVQKIFKETPKEVGLFGLTFLPTGLEKTTNFQADKSQITSIYFYLNNITPNRLEAAKENTICEFEK